MRSGYKLIWSDKALDDLKRIIEHLEENRTSKEIRNFAGKLEKRLEIIAFNPKLFQQSSRKKAIRRSVLTKHTVIYYETSESEVIIITLFDPRQNPKKLKL